MHKTITLSEKNSRFLLFINKTPPDFDDVNSYIKDGFLVSNQIGFYGLITAYFKTENILLKNTNLLYHKQIKKQICTK